MGASGIVEIMEAETIHPYRKVSQQKITALAYYVSYIS